MKNLNFVVLGLCTKAMHRCLGPLDSVGGCALLKNHLREAMYKQQEWLCWVSIGDKVELDPVGFDILVLAQGGVQHAVRWGLSLGALEKEQGMAQEHQKA